MTEISLEQRLKNLEIEQTTQNVALDELNDFGEEIRKLEAVLAKIDNYEVKQHQEVNFSKLRDLKETEKLEKRLAHIDEEYVIDTHDAKNNPQSQKLSEHLDNTVPSVQPELTNASNTVKHSYVICLVFNPKSPQEWSGKGWSRKGKGISYKNPEQVKQIFQKLKKQWPDYPLKIFKR
ncbi:MAG: hypothetical protein DRQ49_07000 [Gammaproteobacteria bacterium]|nr:MAG: hypothetical protein DRQ49_07000 [Gammaproteobacteria bacterium]RKZ43787.1 MAG: hypothetical protein DRQ41_04415 [Gammaproteobacteria bacterium]RKZ77417.1 MAG: hypothetical protein DRQ57_00215 [Gammaproteobacteria bacterium]